MTSDSADLPPFLRPFVLPHDPVDPEPVGDLDLYLSHSTPAPAVLMVHGGPLRADLPARPRQWTGYRGYGALLARAGLVGGMFEHGFVDDDSLPLARDNVHSALATVRADPRVDEDRIGLWFFSAGGLLMGSFLDPAPPGVIAVGGTYSAVGHPDFEGTGLPQALDTAATSSVRLLLVRPELDFDWIVPATDQLLERCAGARREVDVIDVPGAHHGFETVDDTEAAREGIRRSIEWWARALAC